MATRSRTGVIPGRARVPQEAPVEGVKHANRSWVFPMIATYSNPFEAGTPVPEMVAPIPALMSMHVVIPWNPQLIGVTVDRSKQAGPTSPGTPCVPCPANQNSLFPDSHTPF